MLGFNALNFNYLGLTPAKNSAADVIDLYDTLNEKKNNYIATKLASSENTKRAGAAAIGAMGGLMQAAALTGIYALVKTFPKLNIPIIDRFITKNFDKWITTGAIHNPGKGKLHNIFVGLASKYVWAMLSGAGLGFAFNTYNTYQNTKITGKISNIKTGANGSGIASGLTSMASSKEGAEIIKNSIQKNDDKSITITFKGINKEYNITKKELKQASRDYIAIKDEKGNVKDYRKKFSKGDGDILAFEVAFEKYCKDVHYGRMKKDENITNTGYIINEDGDILFNHCCTKDIYYLLTGNKTYDFDKTSQKDNKILDMYTKASISQFIKDYSLNKDKYAAEIRLRGNENLTIRDRNYRLHKINQNTGYSVTNINPKYITISNSEKTREKIEVPISKLNKYIASVEYTKLT